MQPLPASRQRGRTTVAKYKVIARPTALTLSFYRSVPHALMVLSARPSARSREKAQRPLWSKRERESDRDYYCLLPFNRPRPPFLLLLPSCASTAAAAATLVAASAGPFQKKAGARTHTRTHARRPRPPIVEEQPHMQREREREGERERGIERERE
jgi:hypothetical protein